MKFKAIISSTILIAGSAMLISVAPAQAGECSAEDPCHTYAMVDDAGTVTNIIVCQPSVCGKGTFAGSRVVPQVAANPVTNQSQGGYMNNEDGSPVKESGGRFTVVTDAPVAVQKTIESETSTIVLGTSFGSTGKNSFSFEDTVGFDNGTPTFTAEATDINVSATLSFKEVDKTETKVVVGTETISFGERKTEQFVENSVQNNNLTKIMSRWIWYKLSLRGWFL